MLSDHETRKHHDEQVDGPDVDEVKKTVLIYSRDLNFSFSLSAVFQDRFNVITTTNQEMLEPFVSNCGPDLVIIDGDPSEKMIERINGLRLMNENLPIIALYVYSPKEVRLDRSIREQVNSVFYKPFEINVVSKRIEELLS